MSQQCPECETAGLTPDRRVAESSMTTCLGGGERFMDANDVWHVHDVNTTTTSWRCSNGHRWSTLSKPACPVKNCGWGKS